MTTCPPEDAANQPPRDTRQPADFDPIALGRLLLRSTRIGALATLDPRTGAPLVTLTNVATDLDGAPLVLVSRLSHHTRNLLGDARASLLLAHGGKGDALAHPRLTLQLEAATLGDADAARARRRFLARHPKARLYVDFPDFLFFRLAPVMMHLNGGFARAFDGDAGAIMTLLDNPEAFEALERSAVAHMNEDHAEALSLYATKLLGLAKGKWRATGIDPHGLDLAMGDATARIEFAKPVQGAASLRKTLADLAEQARQAPH